MTDTVPCKAMQSIAGRDYPCQREQPRTRQQHSAHQYASRRKGCKGYEITITWHELMPLPKPPEGGRTSLTHDRACGICRRPGHNRRACKEAGFA